MNPKYSECYAIKNEQKDLKHTDTKTQQMLHEDGERWEISYYKLTKARSHQNVEEARMILCQNQHGECAQPILDYGLLASRTVRQYCFIILSY